MGSTYNGIVKEKKTRENIKFNVAGFLIWIGSLLLSLLPVGLSLLQYYNENHIIDKLFWLDCFVNGEVLWVFATILLFAIINNLLKHDNIKLSTLTILGIFAFVIIEGLWLFCRYQINVDEKSSWFLVVGTITVIISLIISTPLQIEFIKRGNE